MCWLSGSFTGLLWVQLRQTCMAVPLSSLLFILGF